MKFTRHQVILTEEESAAVFAAAPSNPGPRGRELFEDACGHWTGNVYAPDVDGWLFQVTVARSLRAARIAGYWGQVSRPVSATREATPEELSAIVDAWRLAGR